jgi:hypothetical protein
MADKADEEADKVLNMKGEYHPNWHQVRDEIFAKLVAERERERLTDAAMKAAEKAVDVAIALEREACAKIADEWAVGWPHPSEVIAERIRARGQE